MGLQVSPTSGFLLLEIGLRSLKGTEQADQKLIPHLSDRK